MPLLSHEMFLSNLSFPPYFVGEFSRVELKVIFFLTKDFIVRRGKFCSEEPRTPDGNRNRLCECLSIIPTSLQATPKE